MSTQENGLPTNIANNLNGQKSIVSSTATNPISMTVTAHGMTTGDWVSIVNHSTQSAANGIWAITRTGVNTFTIPVDGTGFSAGGATGFIRPLSLGPTFAIPADGEALDAASVGVGFEGLADRTAYMRTVTGDYQLISINSIPTDDTGSIGQGLAWASYNLTSNNTWTLANSSHAIWTFGIFVNPQDVLEVEFHGSGKGVAPTPGNFLPNATIALHWANKVPGGSYGAWTKLAGSGSQWSSGQDSTVPHVFVAATDILCRSIFTYTGSLQVLPEFSIQVATADTTQFQASSSFSLVSDYVVTVKQWRPTGLVQ